MARRFAGLIPALALTGAWAGAACAGVGGADRYGPAPAPAPLPDAYAAAPPTYVPSSRETMRAAPTRVLSWPGKSAPTPAVAALPASAPVYAPAAPLRAAPSYAAPSSAPAATVSPRFTGPTPQLAAPPQPYFAAPTPGTPPPASTTLGGPLASAAPALPTQHARLYSVHRAYGMQPDPAPIPPQFFGPTADLSEPATAEPVPNRAANATARNAVNAARLAAEAN